MRKATHWLVTKDFCNNFNLYGKERLCLCLGSVLPDLTFSYVYNQHTLKNQYKRFLNRVHNLKNLKGYRFYIECGMLSHYVGDFFTRPHNSSTFIGSLIGHKSWERNLARKFKETRGSIPLVDCNILRDHVAYLKDIKSLDVDYDYIIKEVTYFLSSMLNGRLLSNVKAS